MPKRALGREVAARAMVLLRNEPVDGIPALPLRVDEIRSIAVIGRLADAPNMGDAGSSDVRPPSHVTPLAGLRAAFPDAQIVYVGEDRLHEAAELAAEADVAIIVAGYDRRSEGEYVDPGALQLPALTVLYPPMADGFGPENCRPHCKDGRAWWRPIIADLDAGRRSSDPVGCRSEIGGPFTLL